MNVFETHYSVICTQNINKSQKSIFCSDLIILLDLDTVRKTIIYKFFICICEQNNPELKIARCLYLQAILPCSIVDI
jgi:hypothetical protein